jgi:hypothetical protein
MLQAREELTFVAQAIERIGRGQVWRQNLQRGALFVLPVGAAGQPDFSHAATPYQPNGFPGAEALAGLRIFPVGVRGPFRVVGLQQTQYLTAEAVISAALLVEDFAAPVFVQRPNLIEDLL